MTTQYTREQLFPPKKEDDNPKNKGGRPRKYHTEEEKREANRNYAREFRAKTLTPIEYEKEIKIRDEHIAELERRIEDLEMKTKPVRIIIKKSS